MPLPNFLIIGAPKCGTSALYAALARHPQIYMSPIKEPYFFAFDGQPPIFAGPDGDYFRQHAVNDWEAYIRLFAAAKDQRVLGEVSTIYLTSYRPDRTAENIRRYLPEARLVAVLRQPAERAYSGFTFCRALGVEPLTDFRQALIDEDQRVAADWRPGFRYWRNGLYAQNLTPYFDRFPSSQIRIYLYEDWRDRPQAVLADLCTFLEVDPELMPGQAEHRNVTYWVRNRWAGWLLRQSGMFKALLPRRLRRAAGVRLRTWNRTRPPLLDPALRSELTEGYRDEILQLQDMLGRDLSHWLRAPTASGISGIDRTPNLGQP
jgi:hypothetical protein